MISAETVGRRRRSRVVTAIASAAAILFIGLAISRGVAAGPEAVPLPQATEYLPSISDLMIVTIQPRHERIWRAEQAFHILAHIPYRLIVIDSELPGLCGIDFVRILHDSREWREIQLVVITSSQSVAFANQIAEYGAFMARKSRWQDDLFSFLSLHDKDPAENSVSDQRV